MFLYRHPERSPFFIKRRDIGSDFHFDVKKAEGLWFRVYPQNMKEIRFAQTLEKNYTILAPAFGDGILIRADLLER